MAIPDHNDRPVLEGAEQVDELEVGLAIKSVAEGSLAEALALMPGDRIESIDDKGVSYRVKPSGKQVYQTRRLDGEAFVRAFAQHILPPKFQKVRYYGFMSPNSKLKLATARWLAWLWRMAFGWRSQVQFGRGCRSPLSLFLPAA